MRTRIKSSYVVIWVNAELEISAEPYTDINKAKDRYDLLTEGDAKDELNVIAANLMEIQIETRPTDTSSSQEV